MAEESSHSSVRNRADNNNAMDNKNGIISNGEEIKNGTVLKENVAMKRRLGIPGGVSLVVGVIIGSGIFISPTGVLQNSGSVGLSLIVWSLCGVITMFGALSEAELGTFITESGGDYTYIREGMGMAIAFIYSWSSVLLLKPSSIAIIALACAQYVLTPFFDDGCSKPPDIAVKLFAITVILTLMSINIYSTKWANRISVFTTLAKVLSLVFIIVGGIVQLARGYTEHLSNAFINTETDPGNIALSFYSGMWAYDGWNNLNFATEELINPHRNLPISLWISMPLVTILYILVNISYFTTLSPAEVLTSPAVAISWAQKLLPQAPWLMPIIVGISTFGATNGSMFSGGRLLYVAARDGNMISLLSMVNFKLFTPLPSLLFTNIVAALMCLPSNIGSLIDLFSFAAWLFYGMVMAALLIMRWTHRDVKRPYKVFILFPIITLLVSAYLVVVPLVTNPKLEYLFAGLAMLTGLIFYFPFVHFKKQIPGMDKITSTLQLWMQVVPSRFEKDESEKQ